VNANMKEKPKFVNIGDYWNDEIVEKIEELLREYQDLFPTTFSEMKGIDGELEEMEISLKEDAKKIRQRPYRLNPKYKEKVKAELDRMIEVDIIESPAESEWIIPMVFQDKKIGCIRIFVDLRKLNDVCLHDPFMTPFTDEVLKNVGGQEAYSFNDGFLGYHWIKITPKDKHKTTFVTEWGSCQYIMMLFGLKNAPVFFLEYFLHPLRTLFISFLKCT